MRRKKVGTDAVADLTVGRDIDDDDWVEIRRAVDGTGYLAPKAVREATPAQQKCLRELQRTVNALEHGTAQLERLVNEARERGLSWATIGWQCGLSGEAVRKRFGDG